MLYTLYGFPKSRTSRVIWTLFQLGIEFEFHLTLPHSTTAYNVNPSGKLPVLSIDGRHIIDSTAICTYLADRHTEAGLSYQQGTIERAELDSWIQFAINDLEAPLWVIAKHTFVLPDNRRVPEILEQCNHEWNCALTTLQQRLGDRPYVMGDKFSIADIILGQIGGSWAKRRSMQINSQKLNHYFERVCSRPAISRAIKYEDKQINPA